MGNVPSTVHVVAWRYNGGGGFNWYHSEDAANRAYEKEKENTHELANSEWTAYRFDYQPVISQSDDDVTDEIDYVLDDLCDSTPYWYKA